MTHFITYVVFGLIVLWMVVDGIVEHLRERDDR